MVTKTSWGTQFTPSATAVNIASAAAAINTVGKYAGLYVWDTTNKRLLRAAGALPTDEWAVVDGSAQVVPV